MTAVPAQVAGVKNICIACPRPVDEVYGTAHMLGIDQVFQMGGAQAIAAFAFGTKTVPRADRIVGPGNIYVAAAKKLLAGDVGIDFVAGPTEILIIANEGDPRFIAADMLAQAEHDTDASAILLTTSIRLAGQVAKEVERQLATLPTAAGRAQSDRQEQRDHHRPQPRRSRGTLERLRARTPQPPSRRAASENSARRKHLPRPVQPRSRGRLCCRTQSRTPHQRRSAPARRTLRRRLRQGHLDPATRLPRACQTRPRHHHAGARRRSRSPRPLRGGAP